MKGVKPNQEEKSKDRTQFVRDMFKKDCQVRAQVGYVDQPLSAPRAQQEFKKKFKVGMNSQRMYQIRAEVFSSCGLDLRGRPLVPQAGAHGNGVASAVAVIPVEGQEQGNFLKKALDELRAKGLIDEDLSVDSVHSHYATVSKFKDE